MVWYGTDYAGDLGIDTSEEKEDNAVSDAVKELWQGMCLFCIKWAKYLNRQAKLHGSYLEIEISADRRIYL